MSRLLLACLAVAIIMAAVVIAGGVVDRLDAATAGAIAGIVLSAITGAFVGITGLVVGVRMGRGMNSYEPPDAPARIYTPPQVQLPAASMRLERDSVGVMTDHLQLNDDVRRIMELRKQGLPPRRRIIEQALATTDHPRIQRAMDQLARYGIVTAGRDGAAREWMQDE